MKVVGWSSLNEYNNRSAYKGVADISFYISKDYRGKGVGKKLLAELEFLAKKYDFYKMVLFTFQFNQLGQALYRNMGFLEAGIFKNHGKLRWYVCRCNGHGEIIID